MYRDSIYLTFRRIGAFIYDSLLIIALMFLLTTLAVALNRGQAIQSSLYLMIVFPVTLVFFYGFWLNGGQTLGMRAWQIKVVGDDASSITSRQALTRYLVGVLLFGLTLLYAPFNKEGKSLADRISNTRIIRYKPAKSIG